MISTMLATIASGIAMATTGTALAAGTATAIGIGGAAAAYGAGASMMVGKHQSNVAKKQMNAYADQMKQNQAQAPDMSGLSDKAFEMVGRKRAGLSQSIFTNPLGLAGEADIAKKTLLGQ